MRLNAYSIFDQKSLQYHVPFFTHTDGAAVRMVQDLVNDLDTSVGRHPGDYSLYMIGVYDDQLGLMVAETPLRHVIDAVALVSIKPKGDLFRQDIPLSDHE